MRKGISLGKWFGVVVTADYSWLAIAVFVTVALSQSFSDVASGWVLWGASAGASILFFLSVLVHELGHSLVAVRRGIRVKRIRLFILGGVSELEHEASSPRDEAAITLAGPALSLILGGLFLVPGLLVPAELPSLIFMWLGSANLILGVFNLLPGFPLDGGRALRAAVWRVTGDRSRGTKIAARSGQVLAMLVMAAGFGLTTTRFGSDGLWMIMVGWFLLITARSAESSPSYSPSLLNAPVGSVMHPVEAYVGPSAPLTAITPGLGPVVPVLDPWGRPLGVVRTAVLARIPASSWSSVTVSEVMTKPNRVVDEHLRVIDALAGVRGRPWLILVNQESRLVGILDDEQLAARSQQLRENVPG